jgi:transcriptional regulator with XRE-family HTH domain
MGKVRVRFKDYLEEHEISAYRVSKHAWGMSPKTVYAIASGRHRPSMEALEKLLAALREITGEEVVPGDLLEYVPEPDAESREWLEDDGAGGGLPPYDWGEGGPPSSRPVRYEPGVGLVVEEG